MADRHSQGVTERWTRVQTLFERALDRPEDERSAWLRAHCGDDPTLYHEVESLLDGDRERHPMFAGQATDLLSRDEIGDLLPSREGERVGAWVLGEPLGEGGMGTVYRADRAESDGPDGFRQPAALKLLKPGMDSQAVVARFRAERRILARLEHPGIARLLDGGLAEDGRPYFAMELVDGEPITAACDARRLDPDARLALFVRACEAVRYAHRSLVVHRDIKPSNLLVVETDEGLRPVLLDFGIARLLEDDHAGDLTRTGHRVLTPAYAAPEQVRGEPPTTATDVYALGGLLYRLLCGAAPLTTSGSPYEAEQAILSASPPRPSTRVTADAARLRGTTEAALVRRLRGDLDTICLKALRKEPERRYGSAGELLADVQRHLDGLPVEARPASRGYRVRKFIARHRAAVWGTAAGLAVIVGVTGVAFARVDAERDRAQNEAAKATEVSAFLEDLFASSDPAQSRGDEVTARELLEAGAERIETELAGQPEVQAQMYGTIGRVYRSLGLLDEAGAALERALALSTDGLAVARAQTALALLRIEQADYAPADSLLALALAAQRQGYDGPHGDLVQTLQTRAALIQQGGAEGYPEPFLMEALAMQRALHSGTHAGTADLLLGLARAHFNTGNFEAADSVLTEALKMRRELFGTVHPGISEALRELAQIRDVQRRDAEGLAVIREAIAIDSQLVGMEHPSMGENLYVQGTLLVELGQFDAATDMFEQTLAIDQFTLGPDHPYVALTLTQLGDVRRRAGDASGAVGYYRRALALQRRVLPEGHPSFGVTLGSLGLALADAGDLSEAESSLREALRVHRLSNDENGVVVLSRRSDLAGVLSQAGKHREAIAITRDALARRIEVRGEESAAAASGLRDLAAALRQQGTPESLREAREVSARALRVYRATHEPGSREMGMALLERADVLRASGQVREARPLYREALDTYRQALGADHPTVRSIERRLAAG